MKFKRINGSKSRPKQPATKRNHTAAAYHPQALAAAGQHIDTERLPAYIATKLPELSCFASHVDNGSLSPACEQNPHRLQEIM
jgi:hypothetical protein